MDILLVGYTILLVYGQNINDKWEIWGVFGEEGTSGSTVLLSIKYHIIGFPFQWWLGNAQKYIVCSTVSEYLLSRSIFIAHEFQGCSSTLALMVGLGNKQCWIIKWHSSIIQLPIDLTRTLFLTQLHLTLPHLTTQLLHHYHQGKVEKELKVFKKCHLSKLSPHLPNSPP